MRRARRIRRLGLAVVLAVTAGCTGDRDAEPRSREEEASALTQAESDALERAEEAATALARDLMERLLEEMEAGGPVSAVRVCSEVAQDLAVTHSRDGVHVRRVSRRVRNPADAPDPFERDALEQLQRLDDQGRLPDRWFEFVEAGADRRLRYLRPIKVMPTCLICHGPAQSLDPEVAQILASRYPNDRALGYAAGDLRGAISVTVSLD